MKHLLYLKLNKICSSIGGANIPNTIPKKLDKMNIELYLQINQLITIPLRDECTQEMYTPSKSSK